MTEPLTRRIGIDGIDVAVETLGSGAQSVLFVHGLGSNRGCWYRAREYFDLERYRLILPDFPGFGDSARPTDFDYSMASLGRCLAQVLRELEIEHPHVVAHSMGCVAALSMLETSAIRPASFLVAEGNLVAEDAFMSAKIARFAEQDFLRSYPRWVSVMQGFWRDEPNEQHERFIESLRNASPIAMYRASVSCNERTRSGALARQFALLTCPVAYFYGTNTLKQRPIPEVVQLSHVQRFAVPDQGHFMMQAADCFYPQAQVVIAASELPRPDGCP